MTLLVDGTDVKETAPPASGEDLGFFHFDLTQKSGGFSGGSEPHEVFDACVESGANVTSMPQPDVAEAPTVNETPPTDTVEPSTPPTFGQGTTEYYGGKETRTNPALAADATMNPDYKKAATQSTAPVAAKEPAPPPTGGQGTTEYFGGAESRSKSAWPTEATMNPDYDKSTLPGAASSTTPTVAIPVREAALQSCRDALSTEAQAAKIYFANSSIVIEPGSRAELRKIAKIIAKNCASVVVEVGGYTDNLGNPENNKTLSQLRANAVVEFLIAKGVGASSLKALGYGEDEPIATNATLEGRRLNRRVEFVVSGP